MASEGFSKEKIGSLLREKEIQRKERVMTLYEYIDELCRDARPARTSFQRIYDMILDAGVTRETELRQKIAKYKFFENCSKEGAFTKDSLFGLDLNMMKLVRHIKNGAQKRGAEKRLLLLEGPVGSAKSTIARLLKRGLEKESLRNPIYTLRWKGLGAEFGGKSDISVDGVQLYDAVCQLHEEPLKLLDPRIRDEILHQINAENRSRDLMRYKVEVEDELCPQCKFNYDNLIHYYHGDWDKVMQHVEIFRFFMSEADRVGIATFSPKDEKNQDSTELTGNIDYRKIAILGSDTDPRAFNFNGEFHVANRGMIEFIEVLKLEVAFLYDLLGATEERLVKPKKQPQTSIDELIIAHTNEPELKKLEGNEQMEAFRSRTKKIKVPYNLRLSNEIKIYEKDYGANNLGSGVHMSPHTIEMAATWAILSRMDEPKEQKLSLLQKLDLYDGKSVADVGEEIVRKLKEDGQREGLYGISPRFIQDVLGDTLASDTTTSCVNVFMVLNEIREKLKTSILISKDEDRMKYGSLLAQVQEKFEDIVKDEIQRAFAADESAISELFHNYVNNVKAYVRGEKLRNEYTGYENPPDEGLMTSIEAKIGVTDSTKKAFRSEIMNHIAALALEKKVLDYRSDAKLFRALTQKLFEQKKDSINFRSITEGVRDAQEQEKIDVIKTRLIKDFGYCPHCAQDILIYASSIFARGDSRKR